MRAIRFLLWLYLGLLLCEGALRKWILPQWSDPLLLVRDPVVLLIYAYAWRLRLFPTNAWILGAGLLAVVTLGAALLADAVNPWVMLFGFRTNFLHLPLIFIVPQVFQLADVRRVGTILLWAALPMALLMVLQFRAAPQDWINAGVGGGGQISAALGKIRPAAAFSFVSGPIYFFAAVAAFILFNQVTAGAGTSFYLSVVAGGATLIAGAVSGSRSLLGAVGVVVVSFLAGQLLYPRAAWRAVRLLVILGVVFIAVSATDIYRDGTEVLTTRIANAAGSEGGVGGFIQRFVNGFSAPLTRLSEVPVFGYGFGLGTNGGAALIGKRWQFLLAEDEWGRVMMESGPWIGLAFIFLRLLLAGYLGWLAVQAARAGNLLPLLLFGAIGMSVLIGQWGQPTIQGFTVLLSGLLLAALRTAENPQKVHVPAGGLVGKGVGRFVRAEAARPVWRKDIKRGADPVQPGRFAVRPVSSPS
jgi:hypothetical protein